jgi:hypothetical protein
MARQVQVIINPVSGQSQLILNILNQVFRAIEIDGIAPVNFQTQPEATKILTTAPA